MFDIGEDVYDYYIYEYIDGPSDYNCVPPVATQVNNKLLLHFRACSAYLVTPQDLLTIFD